MPTSSVYIPNKVYKQQLLLESFQSITGVVAVWPMMRMGSLCASVAGGFGYHLTEIGAPTYGRASQGGPFVNLNGSSYIYAADDAWNSITGDMTAIWWVQFAAAAAAQEVMCGKWLSSGDQRSWWATRDASGNTTFSISPDGTSGATVTSGFTATAIVTSWTFVAVRFTASAEMKIWVNALSTAKSSGVPARIYDGTGRLQIGSYNFLTTPMTGKIGLFGLYGAAVPDATIASLYAATQSFYGV